MAFTEAQIQNIKVMLEMQADGYKNSIQLLHSDVQEMRKQYDADMYELKKSLEYSQKTVDNLESKVSYLEKEMQNKTSLQNEIDELKTKLNKQEDFSRRNNIRIDGIEETPNDNYGQTKKKVEDFIRIKLELNSIQVDIARRIPSS